MNQPTRLHMRNKLVIFLILFVLAGFLPLRAQQEAQFTQYMFNNMSYNPGYAGINGPICLNLFGRTQWMGFDDPSGQSVTPKTALFSLDAPIRFLHGGLGGVVLMDNIGFEKNIGVKLNYSYHVNVGTGTLGIGAGVSFLNKKLDFSKLKGIDPTDPIITGKNIQSDFITDFSFGAFYKVPQKFYVGLSASQLAESQGDAKKTGVKLKRTFWLTGGYEYVLPNNPSFVLLPSLLVKTDLVSAQYDVSALMEYQNQFFGGLNYRVQDAISLIAGVNLLQANNDNATGLKLGVSYDLTTSKLSGKDKSSGTFEVFARYCFKIVIPPTFTKYGNTRKFR